MIEEENIEWKTIRISDVVYDSLRKKGYVDETFDDVLRRLLGLESRNVLKKIKEKIEKLKKERSEKVYGDEKFLETAKEICQISENDIKLKLDMKNGELIFMVGKYPFASMSPKTTTTATFEISWWYKDREGNTIEEKDVIPGNDSFANFKKKIMLDILPKIKNAFKITKKIAEEYEGKGAL
ncbi:MAG TPA: hypothetical protein ENI33_02535 [Thermoplasmatales archaeon]|nr:hypothetical protein [Thermoplasmatales archaeon]